MLMRRLGDIKSIENVGTVSTEKKEATESNYESFFQHSLGFSQHEYSDVFEACNECKSLLAFVIFKGFLTTMNSLMPDESSMQTKGLPTFLTFIRSFITVNSIKYSKLIAVTKSFATFLTHKRCFHQYEFSHI